jgi:hypothetical protein
MLGPMLTKFPQFGDSREVGRSGLGEMVQAYSYGYRLMQMGGPSAGIGPQHAFGTIQINIVNFSNLAGTVTAE